MADRSKKLDSPMQWFFTDAVAGKSQTTELGTKREALELVRNFMNILPESRKHFLSLAKSIASADKAFAESAAN